MHLSLVAAVATQYLSARALDDQVALARRTLEAVESSSALARRTFEAGRTSELDVRTAEAQVHTARFNLSSARVQRARAENALVLLVGQPLPPDLPPPQPLDAQAFLAELPPGVPSETLLRRPDILGGRARAPVGERGHRRGARGVLPVHLAHRVRRHLERRAVGPVRLGLGTLELHAAAQPADLQGRRAPREPRRRAP